MQVNAIKKALGAFALRYVKNGMLIGLGTGSTADYFIHALGQACAKGLCIKAVSSSERSFLTAKKLGITVLPLEGIEQVDVTVDGADEVDPKKNLIKGAGGAHLREKILASFSRSLIILVDDTKLVQKLGQKKPLPVEVLPFGLAGTKKQIEALATPLSLRTTEKGEIFRTDSGGLLFDLALEGKDVASLHEKLLHLPAVVDTGYFPSMASEVVVGYSNGEVSLFSS